MSLSTLLKILDDDQDKDAFGDILTTLRALARRWKLAKGMLRLVQLTAVTQAVNLPAQAEVLRDLEIGFWGPDDHLWASSLHPNLALLTDHEEGSDISHR
ncbi:hypothetical protein N7462_009139 [Penicillium macrosclerotiorum]|uniref:uncharacterized protein n=1 Tax=Penicillium macrosclerotiorum TaxID=303699 RepID=UPI0025474351|nr:uncharacterized protein N7462_009139 [Penicillium macrosclerotiorum]KAJ5676242.1 hypothetical protein N7462_009139 [Penicillium macrosclerotiorum]